MIGLIKKLLLVGIFFEEGFIISLNKIYYYYYLKIKKIIIFF